MAPDIRLDDSNNQIVVDGGERVVLQGSDRVVLQGRVVVVDGRLNLKPIEGERALPTQANYGDLYMTITSQEVLVGTVTETSLWLCVPPALPSLAGGPAVWRQIQLGEEVVGP